MTVTGLETCKKNIKCHRNSNRWRHGIHNSKVYITGLKNVFQLEKLPSGQTLNQDALKSAGFVLCLWCERSAWRYWPMTAESPGLFEGWAKGSVQLLGSWAHGTSDGFYWGHRARPTRNRKNLDVRLWDRRWAPFVPFFPILSPLCHWSCITALNLMQQHSESIQGDLLNMKQKTIRWWLLTKKLSDTF